MSSVNKIKKFFTEMEEAYKDLKKVKGEDTVNNRQTIGEFGLLNAVTIARSDGEFQPEEAREVRRFMLKHPEVNNRFYSQFKADSFSDQLRVKFLAHVIANQPPPLAPDAKTIYTNKAGQTYPDRYRSMETFSDTSGKIDPRAQAYIDNLSRYSTMLLEINPEIPQLRAELQTLNNSGVNQSVNATRNPDGSYIYTARKPGETGLERLYQKTIQGDEIPLFDPNKLTKPGEKWGINSFSVSPSGRYIFYTLTKNGDKKTRISGLIDTEKKDSNKEIALNPPIKRTFAEDVAWLPDETGFFYSLSQEIKPGMTKEELFLNKTVRYRSLDQKTDELILNQSLDSGVQLTSISTPRIHIHPDSNFVLLETYEGVSKEKTLYVKRLAEIQNKSVQWQKVADANENKVHGFALNGNTLYLVTRENASAGKVVAINLNDRRSNIRTASVVIRHNPKIVIKNVLARADGLYIHQVDRIYSHLYKMNYAQPGTLKEIKLPFAAELHISGEPYIASASPKSRGVVFTGFSWIHPNISFTYDPAKGEVETTGLQMTPRFNSEDYAMQSTEYSGLDGVKVPIFFYYNKKLYPHGLPKNGQGIPYDLKGYGSYGKVYQDFAPSDIVFLDRKGVIAYPGIRGGGEYGDAWHNAGKIETKHNTWEDEGMAAKFLIDRGYTTRGRIIADNFSAGGFAGARAAVDDRFKEYFAGVYNDGCVLDQVRSEYEPDGRVNIVEFDSTETNLPAQLKMSPLHQIKSGVRYAKFFVNVDRQDEKVLVQEGFKFAAEIAYAHPDNQPILSVSNMGHVGAGGDVDDEIQKGAKKVAWMLWITGQSRRMDALYQQALALAEATKLKATKK